jgi:hypothetical protein
MTIIDAMRREAVHRHSTQTETNSLLHTKWASVSNVLGARAFGAQGGGRGGGGWGRPKQGTMNPLRGGGAGGAGGLGERGGSMLNIMPHRTKSRAAVNPHPGVPGGGGEMGAEGGEEDQDQADQQQEKPKA